VEQFQAQVNWEISVHSFAGTAMARPEHAAVVRSIEQLSNFLEKFGEGEQNRVALFREFARRMKSEGLTKSLFREISRANDDASSQLDEQVLGGRTLPGKDQDETRRELRASCMAVNNALFPIEQPPAELDISDFAGSDNVTHKALICRGDPSGARAVLERSIAFVQRYSQTLVRNDIVAAYAMADTGLRAAMSFDEFKNLHQHGDGPRRHGPLTEFVPERVVYVLTDDEARQASDTAKEGWHKATAKENRRSRVIGFWYRDRKSNTICRGALWLSEESGEYRLANLDLSDE
jgi:hypothetical protein